MKKITLILVALVSFAIAKDDKVNLKIAGMQCAYSCADKVTKVVENIKGVKDCEVDFASNTAIVVFDDKKLDSKEIIDVLKKKTSYKVEIQSEKKVKSI
ncbi:MAG: heavy-metal-associated domain-containing protein [Candidatus Marinimicrobia bacterium]|jgi:copper chaperone CopZ|nr:heavy-metal-associated domain-containing protein [Candidatus Neomarinimicrobiota bacterium]MBT4828273.1 heavy-metal-associated domain-containing protein [Candidatus Neomarinimicrobiota bacterium]MBT5225756.1 heavy-metal-associated domain-containing protein [Candidatus Neomarinimicrobiota bacterium]MBT5720581.1 heavy-metal-associated domain-containing protein [Candidatus Neomarinimicrobiota bacterium]MBT6711051.1 heavy-metal-associated domain-containing protein [Candidatus Neomarinimicrobiota